MFGLFETQRVPTGSPSELMLKEQHLLSSPCWFPHGSLLAKIGDYPMLLSALPWLSMYCLLMPAFTINVLLKTF